MIIGLTHTLANAIGSDFGKVESFLTVLILGTKFEPNFIDFCFQVWTVFNIRKYIAMKLYK